MGLPAQRRNRLDQEDGLPNGPPKEAVAALDRAYELIFEDSPVMLHSSDRQGRLLRVNRRWAETLGYARGEVLGKNSFELLTEGSRVRMAQGATPLLWRAGAARSVGIEVVKGDGKVLDMLFDADVVHSGPTATESLFATVDFRGAAQWEEARVTLEALRELSLERRSIETALSGGHRRSIDQLPAGSLTENAGKRDWMTEGLASLAEHAQDISTNLRGLTQAHQQSLDTMVEQQGKLLDVAREISKTLRYLSEAASFPDPSPE